MDNCSVLFLRYILITSKNLKYNFNKYFHKWPAIDPGFPSNKGGGTIPLFVQNVPKHCMKMKRIGMREGGMLHRFPLESANNDHCKM